MRNSEGCTTLFIKRKLREWISKVTSPLSRLVSKAAPRALGVDLLRSSKDLPFPVCRVAKWFHIRIRSKHTQQSLHRPKSIIDNGNRVATGGAKAAV